MAEVFAARLVGAEGFSRRVALKTIRLAFSEDPHFAKLFIAEAKMAALLSHPNIVSVLDFDRNERGCLYLAMELVDGCDLAHLCSELAKRGHPLSPGLAIFVCGEVLRALDYAHRLTSEGRWLGIVHRDVSPHNVLLSRTGSVKLGDFGIAKATAASAHSGMVRGKIPYMPPEQANGQLLDGRSDLFAVGVMLYELLAGVRPFDGLTDAETLTNVLLCRHTPLGQRVPGVPHDVQHVVARLLMPAREHRFQTAQDALRAMIACRCYPPDGTTALAALVSAILGPESPPVRNSGPEYLGEISAPAGGTRTLPPPPQRRRGMVAAGIGAALIAAVAVFVWLAPRAHVPAATSAPGPKPDAGQTAPATIHEKAPPVAAPPAASPEALPAPAPPLAAPPAAPDAAPPEARPAKTLPVATPPAAPAPDAAPVDASHAKPQPRRARDVEVSPRRHSKDILLPR